MFNQKYKETTLTASAHNTKITIEIPWDSTASDLLDAFKTIMVGLGYNVETFDEVLEEYLENNRIVTMESKQFVDDFTDTQN